MHAQSRYFAPICALAVAAAPLLIAGSAAAAESPEQPGKIEAISPVLCEAMKLHKVLTADAPVSCGRLSLVTFRYVGFDGHAHDNGEIVVMDAAAQYVLGIFVKLQEMRFPIAKARLMDHYDGNDDAAMADDNTSAFNARKIAGSNSISLHAYGLAIDINPVQNPSLRLSGAATKFAPPSGIAYANRFNDRPWKPARAGMAEAVIDVFADSGFLIWGGYWDDPIDYQHFQIGRSLAQELARLPPVQSAAAFTAAVERYRACRAGSAHASRTECVAKSTPNSRPDF